MSDHVCCPLSGDDGSNASCSTTSRPKARKPHECCECGEAIPAGAVYERLTGVWDGDAATFKTCASCVEIRDHFARGCGGHLITWLWRDLEENMFPDMKAGGPCMRGLSPAAIDRLITRRYAWYLAGGASIVHRRARGYVTQADA